MNKDLAVRFELFAISLKNNVKNEYLTDDSFVSNLRFNNRNFLFSNKINYIVQTHYIISVGKLMSRREMISSLKLKIGLAVIFQGKHENRPQHN